MSTNQSKLILGILAPLITAAAAWLTAAVAKYGVHLDSSGVNAALVTGATAGVAVMVKLIHDIESKLDKKVDVKVPATDAQLIDSVLKALEPELRQAAAAAVQTEVLNLAHSIQPPAPAPTAPPVPAAAVAEPTELPSAEPAEPASVQVTEPEPPEPTPDGVPADPSVAAVRATIAAAKSNGSNGH